MFTGKRKEDLDMDIINSVDLLIDGPFINSQLDTERVLLGSKNKRLCFVTNRYRLKEKYFKNKISIEEITAEDFIFINGD